MTRRTLLSGLLAIMVMAITLFIAAPANASAQHANCATYTVDIKGISNACLPIRVATLWDCIGTVHTLVNTYTANGVHVTPITLPPCATPYSFVGASLDNSTFVPLGQSGRFVIGNCCYLLQVGLDVNGCIYITVRPC